VNFLPWRHARKPETSRAGVVQPIEFTPARWPEMGLRTGGILTYSIDRSTRRVRVSISWEDLTKVREELTRNGKGYNETVVTTKILSQWACEQLRSRAQPSGEVVSAGLVLAFGEDRREIRDLLHRCRLL
jgi:hypothetical protein